MIRRRTSGDFGANSGTPVSTFTGKSGANSGKLGIVSGNVGRFRLIRNRFQFVDRIYYTKLPIVFGSGDSADRDAPASVARSASS
jgi:hypothetical protein